MCDQAEIRINQRKRVLEYMQVYDSINPITALRDLGIMRLSARISELKTKDNIKIKKKMVPIHNRWGEEVFIAKYSLDKGEEEETTEETTEEEILEIMEVFN